MSAILAARGAARVAGLSEDAYAPYDFLHPRPTFDQHLILARRASARYLQQLCPQIAHAQRGQGPASQPDDASSSSSSVAAAPLSPAFLPYDVALRSALLLADIEAAEHALLPSLRARAACRDNVDPITGFRYDWIDLDVTADGCQSDGFIDFQGTEEADVRLGRMCGVADANSSCPALPLSSLRCVNAGQVNHSLPDTQLCTLRNVLYHSATDRWYFHHRQPPQPDVVRVEQSDPLSFSAESGNVFSSLPHAIDRVHHQPVLLSVPPHSAVFHGAMEQPLTRFVVASLYQNLSFFVDDSELQTFTAARLMDLFPHNWDFYERTEQSADAVNTPPSLRDYGRSLRSPPAAVSMFSYRQPVHRVVQRLQSDAAELLKRVWSDEWVWFDRVVANAAGARYTTFHSEGYVWEKARRVDERPFPASFYAAKLSAYHDWVLRRLGLPSRLAQNLHRAHAEPGSAALSSSFYRFPYAMLDPSGEYQEADCPTCEYVVVINRGGSRRINNADALLAGLRLVLPGVGDDGPAGRAVLPELRLWPRVTDWGVNYTRNAAFARRVRLLVAAHGAGLTFAFFMRPGAVVLENDGARCGWQREMFGIPLPLQDLHFAQYTPIFDTLGGTHYKYSNECDVNGNHDVVVEDVVQQVVELLDRERDERAGKYTHAIANAERG